LEVVKKANNKDFKILSLIYGNVGVLEANNNSDIRTIHSERLTEDITRTDTNKQSM
jgi:hypothetical protein